MIKVTIDLIPFGIGEPETLGTVEIANDATGTATRGNYNVKVKGKDGRVLRTGRVEGFPRKRLLGADLLYRALRETVGERNEKSKAVGNGKRRLSETEDGTGLLEPARI
jgi:hypothetical protein